MNSIINSKEYSIMNNSLNKTIEFTKFKLVERGESKRN